jgi:hypothetical protein
VISDDAKTFLRAVIRSVWALELLLLLRKQRDRAWTVDALTRELRASDTAIRQALPNFRIAGLIQDEADETIRYTPATTQLDALVQEVASEYANRPFAILNEILAPRETNVEQFARAFRIRKDD